MTIICHLQIIVKLLSDEDLILCETLYSTHVSVFDFSEYSNDFHSFISHTVRGKFWWGKLLTNGLIVLNQLEGEYW